MTLMVTKMKMMTMVAGEKEAVWIHHDRRPSVEMPARGLLNEGTSRDGDRDNERPWIPDNLGDITCFIIYMIKFMAYQHLCMVLKR